MNYYKFRGARRRDDETVKSLARYASRQRHAGPAISSKTRSRDAPEEGRRPAVIPMYKSIILFTVAPVCRDDRIIVVGASRGESLDIACRVEADPPAHNFRWKFNNSGETLEVAPGRFSMEKSSGVSVLRYTPTTELDYGTLSCWADNLVGTQSRPCLFQLVAAGEYIR